MIYYITFKQSLQEKIMTNPIDQDAPELNLGSMGAAPGAATNQTNAQPQQPQYTYQEPIYHSGNAVSQLANLGRVTSTGNAGSGTPIEIQKLLDDAAARTYNDPKAIRLISLVIEDPKLNIPAIVEYLVFQKKIIYTVLLLEKLGQPLNNIMQPLGNRQIEIDMPTIRYWDQTMRDLVEDTIRRHPGTAGLPADAPIHSVSVVVVPESVDLKDVNRLAPFYDHITAAIAAAQRSVQGNPTSDITFNILADRSLQLVAKHDVRPGSTFHTPTGEIIAGDFMVTLSARNSNTNMARRELHNVSGDVTLSSVVAYIDVAYHEPESKYIQVQPGMPVMPVAGYDPLVVITQITPLGKTSRANDDLLTQLFGLASVSGILSEYRWATVFARGVGDSGGKTSIGVLGLEHNPYPGTKHTPQILNVVAGNDIVQGSDRLTALGIIQIYCTPTMTVALDVVQGGPLAWAQSIFANATPGSTEEWQIIRELDAFSGGGFTRIWSKLQQPILAMPSAEIHLGHYTDENGNLCDIRKLDYLTMLEATQGDLSIMMPYSAGFQPGNGDPGVIDQTRRIIKTYAPTAVFTGMATRIFFNTNFINALDQMFSACGLQIIMEGLGDISGMGNRRGMFNSQYLSGINNSGVFQQFGNASSNQFITSNWLKGDNLPGSHRF